MCTASAGWGAGPLAVISVSLVPQPGPPQPPGLGGWELPTPSCFLLQAPLVFRALALPSRAGCLASEEELMSTLPQQWPVSMGSWEDKAQPSRLCPA